MRYSLLFLMMLLLSFKIMAFEKIIKGESVAIGNGTAYTYVIYDEKNCPRSLGVALSKSALKALPETDSSYTLKLPGIIKLPPYKDVVINWNAHGHEPTDIYGIPHFDFHFYAISETERNSIMCMDQDNALCLKQPGSEYLPAYYVPTPAGVSMMGWHWLDSRSPELHGARFTSTFIYGYYNAKVIFVEPMITREFLLDHGTVNAEIPMPDKFAISGYYPQNYILKYDEEMSVYRIILKNLKKF